MGAHATTRTPIEIPAGALIAQSSLPGAVADGLVTFGHAQAAMEKGGLPSVRIQINGRMPIQPADATTARAIRTSYGVAFVNMKKK